MTVLALRPRLLRLLLPLLILAFTALSGNALAGPKPASGQFLTAATLIGAETLQDATLHQAVWKISPKPAAGCCIAAEEGAADGGSFLYRGVSSDHPNFESYLNGDVVPGDVNGTITPEEHNLFGDDPFVQAQSPYTSWTTDPGLAASRAGDGGVVLRLPTGAPPPGATWSWVWSPDAFGESEVLLQGTRSGATVIGP